MVQNATYLDDDDTMDQPQHRRVTMHPSITFVRIPELCSADNRYCTNKATRLSVNHGEITGYCDSCMLDKVLQGSSVTVR